MFILACFAVLAVIAAYLKLTERKKKAGIKGWVQSQDLDGRGKRTYRDLKTGITARPDIVTSDRVIEYKSYIVKDKPRHADMLQVTAEMIAAEKDIGELRYSNKKNFEFNMNSPKIRSIRGELERIKGQMEWHLRTRTPPKVAPTRNKCAKCDYRRECSESKTA